MRIAVCLCLYQAAATGKQPRRNHSRAYGPPNHTIYHPPSHRGRLDTDYDQTFWTEQLNQQIKMSEWPDVYTGGKGVLIRNPYDGYEKKPVDELTVLPATYWSNDIFAPSQMFPSSEGCSDDWDATHWNVDCPNDQWNGFWSTDGCTPDPGNLEEDSPWNYPSMAYVVGSAMTLLFQDYDNMQSDDWQWGVFYPTDSNSVDYRCRYLPEWNIFDCGPDPYNYWGGGYIPVDADDPNVGQWVPDDTKFGSGAYPAGNPTLPDTEWRGGGTGCHFDKRIHMVIDQSDASDSYGVGLTKNYHCQCNNDLADGNDWTGWVMQWVNNAVPKPGLEDEAWFANGKAPFRALDQVSCWTGNARDMINLQNAVWWNRFEWSNQLSPKTNWQDDYPQSMRIYWGWNEIPISHELVSDPNNWDAVIIKLPAAICEGDAGGSDSIYCMNTMQQFALERMLNKWTSDQYLIPGFDMRDARPGSSVVVVREWMDESINWFRWFFCEPWTSPNNAWQVAFETQSADWPAGLCYLDWAGYEAGWSHSAGRSMARS